MHDTPPAPQKNPLIVATIVWTALLLSQLMYFFVASALSNRKELPVESRFFDFTHPLTNPFIAVSLVALILSIAIPKAMIRRNQQVANSVTSQNSIESLLPRFYPAFIVRLALLESIPLFGFVLALTQHDVKRMVPFAVVSFLGFILNFPNESKVRSLSL